MATGAMPSRLEENERRSRFSNEHGLGSIYEMTGSDYAEECVPVLNKTRFIFPARARSIPISRKWNESSMFADVLIAENPRVHGLYRETRENHENF